MLRILNTEFFRVMLMLWLQERPLSFCCILAHLQGHRLNVCQATCHLCVFSCVSKKTSWLMSMLANSHNWHSVSQNKTTVTTRNHGKTMHNSQRWQAFPRNCSIQWFVQHHADFLFCEVRTSFQNWWIPGKNSLGFCHMTTETSNDVKMSVLVFGAWSNQAVS